MPGAELSSNRSPAPGRPRRGGSEGLFLNACSSSASVRHSPFQSPLFLFISILSISLHFNLVYFSSFQYYFFFSNLLLFLSTLVPFLPLSSLSISICCNFLFFLFSHFPHSLFEPLSHTTTTTTQTTLTPM